MAIHEGNTGKTTEVKLPSAIEKVYWTRSHAAPGATVGLEIFSRFVGSGAVLEIALSDHDGRTYGTFKDKLHANRFTSVIVVPAKASGALYADVKLPDHGLSMHSPPLLLMSSVSVTNAAWDADEARQGDVLTLSADVEGVPDGAEAEISVWEHDHAGAHGLVTRLPTLVRDGRIQMEWELDRVGTLEDVLANLDAGTAGARFFFQAAVAGVTAQSNLLDLHWAVLQLVGEADEPVPGQRYRIELPDGSFQEGHLDDAGLALVADVADLGACWVSFPDLDKDSWTAVP